MTSVYPVFSLLFCFPVLSNNEWLFTFGNQCTFGPNVACVLLDFFLVLLKLLAKPTYRLSLIIDKHKGNFLLTFAGDSCPAVRKYPLKCPSKINVSPSKSPSVCCYHNGPNCCHPGGKRCTDRGSGIRDYCPRPNDNKQLKYCCVTSEGKPSCCVSSAVCPKIR